MTTAQGPTVGAHRTHLGSGVCGTVQMARVAPTRLFCSVIKTLTYSPTGMTPEHGMRSSETMKGDTTVASG